MVRPSGSFFAVPAVVLLSLGLLAVMCVPASARAAGGPEILLVFDASGSMWGQVPADGGPKNKIVIAREVLAGLAADLPDDAEVGLVAYGHRREGDCDDVETVVPMAPLDRTALVAAVEGLNPKGKTPITRSLDHAFDALEGRASTATVILLSDGLETCGGDPCSRVRLAREAGLDFVFHVVGFDVAGEDVSSLECAAQAGGGLYFDAADAGELAAALDRAVAQAVAPPETPPGRLSVRVTENGDLADAAVTVVPPGGATADGLAAGRTYTHGETNPRLFPVATGTYDLIVKPTRIQGGDRRIEGVEVAEGEVTELTVEIGSGEIAVGVTGDGELADAAVEVAPAGGGRAVAGGRTYTSPASNPKVFSVPPGSYRVTVRPLGVDGMEPRIFEEVVVEPGERTERSVAFETGTIAVGATAGAELVDAAVSITPSAGGRAIAGGRTYTDSKSNPKRFVVVPGSYRIEVKPVRYPGGPQSFEVTVGAGETVLRQADYPPG